MTPSSTRRREDILGLDLEELTALIEPVSGKAYTARQIFSWMYAKGVFNFGSMHNLSKPLRKSLSDRFYLELPGWVTSRSSPRERVFKYLLSLVDKSTIECVLIGMRDRETFCVSSQVGCRFGCAFCATGRMGFVRNLSAGEILGQVLFLRSASKVEDSHRDHERLRDGFEASLKDGDLPTPTGIAGGSATSQGRSETDAQHETASNQVGSEIEPDLDATAPQLHSRIGTRDEAIDSEEVARTQSRRGFNVVFMGMGEPLDNYDSTVKAIRIMQHPEGLAVGGRRITVSTCGIPAKIKRLAKEDLGVGLALSLNATTDELRSKLIPAGRQFRLKRVLEATSYFAEKTGRRVTLEYVLIAGVNDKPGDVKRLVSIASSMPCKINVIALNVSPGIRLEPPSNEAVQRFVELLYPHAPAVTLRKSKGSDIMAACGQLRTDSVRAERGTGEFRSDARRTRPERRPRTDVGRTRPRRQTSRDGRVRRAEERKREPQAGTRRPEADARRRRTGANRGREARGRRHARGPESPRSARRPEAGARRRPPRRATQSNKPRRRRSP
jgi:23S rRNA (adenine2503-C2)-methyltransferase